LSHLDFDIVSDFDIRISSLWRTFSTLVEKVRQIRLFMQNKPNFPRFSLKKACLAEKQTQFKPNQSQFSHRLRDGKNHIYFGPKIRMAKPNKPKTNPIAKKAIINISSFTTSKYEKIGRWRAKEPNLPWAQSNVPIKHKGMAIRGNVNP